MSVTGDYAKLNKAIAELGRLGPGVINVAAANVAQALVAEVQMGFRKQAAPDGTKWAPLKKTRARNAKAGGGKGKILRDTGRLASSITGSSSGANVIVGTNVEYGPYHQFGTNGHSASFARKQAVDAGGMFTNKTKGKRKAVGSRVLTFKEGNGAIPARPFLPINDIPASYVKEIALVLVDVLKKTAPALLGAAE